MPTHIIVTELDPEVHEEQSTVPEGYELCFDNTEPLWEGPGNDHAWARWHYDKGIMATITLNDDKTMISIPIDKAKELHRNLTGLLELMGELEPAHKA
ncbi:hypothetical protein GCM10023063_28460 [Arthrobacter methylotrophus]|uniref:Uncharacterized protein n=1 Tax=Arthrobacter methylotrophus TaxID=121291 RepID=A0ABV5URW6_9MICC